MNRATGGAIASGMWFAMNGRLAAASRRASGQIVIGHCQTQIRRGISTWPFVRGLTAAVDAETVGYRVTRWAEGLERHGFDEPSLQAQRFTSTAVLEEIAAAKLTLGRLSSIMMGAVVMAALPVLGAALVTRVLGLAAPPSSLLFQALT